MFEEISDEISLVSDGKSNIHTLQRENLQARGVSTEALRLCDGRFTVPLHGLSESPEARAALGALWDTDTDNLTTELVIWWRDLKGQVIWRSFPIWR